MSGKVVYGNTTTGILKGKFKKGNYKFKVRFGTNKKEITDYGLKNYSAMYYFDSDEEAIESFKEYQEGKRKEYEQNKQEYETEQKELLGKNLNKNANNSHKDLTLKKYVYFESEDEKGLFYSNIPLKDDGEKYAKNTIKGMVEQLKTLSDEKYKKFNTKRLLEFDKEDAENFIRELRNRDIANATLDKYLRTLKVVFNSLETELQLRKEGTNPFTGVKVGSVGKRDKTSLNAITEYDVVKEELLKKASDKEKDYIFYLIALTSMMRRGEIAALRWEDIDFKNNVIKIEGVLEANEFSGGVSYKPSTKNGEKRITIMVSEVADLLQKLKIRQGNRNLWKDTSAKYHNLVFKKKDDTPYSLKHWSDGWRDFRSSLLKREVISKQTTLHDLRGSGITYHLLTLHTPVNVVANMVGHEDVSITLNVYGNAEEESVYQLARDMNKSSNVKVNNKKIFKNRVFRLKSK